MDDKLEQRLAAVEATVNRIEKAVGQNHTELMRELKREIYDIHRNIHYRGCVDTAAYVAERMQGAPRFEDRSLLLDHLAKLSSEIDGDVLEFGVSGGGSMKLLCQALPDRHFYGFDSFEGLPEDWYLTVKKGAYAYSETKLEVPANATLVPGWFDRSLPKFLESFRGAIALIHVDSDIYSSAATVLGLLRPLIRRGCVIEFDEYMNYGGWREHEFLAWQEFVAANDVRYEYVGYTRNGFQAAVRVTRIGT